MGPAPAMVTANVECRSRATGACSCLRDPGRLHVREDRSEVDARAAPRMRVAMSEDRGRGAVRAELAVLLRREIGHGVDRDAELGRDVLRPVAADAVEHEALARRERRARRAAERQRIQTRLGTAAPVRLGLTRPKGPPSRISRACAWAERMLPRAGRRSVEARSPSRSPLRRSHSRRSDEISATTSDRSCSAERDALRRVVPPATRVVPYPPSCGG